jgi:hypothetical protein
MKFSQGLTPEIRARAKGCIRAERQRQTISATTRRLRQAQLFFQSHFGSVPYLECEIIP